MLFSRRPKHSYKPQKTNWATPKLVGLFLVGVSVAFLLIAASKQQGQAVSPFSNVLMTPISAFQGVRQWGLNLVEGVRLNFNARNELAKLIDETELLRRENIELNFKLQRYDAYRAALNLPDEPDYHTVKAVVFTHDLRFTRDIIINRGEKDGLAINMPVWTTSGLVGRTRRVSNQFAKVQLLTDPGSAVGVYVEGTHYEGILRGSETNNQMLLTDLHLVELGDSMNLPEPGQAVYTSGVGMIFPRGLLAGYITETSSDYGYVVEPAVNFHAVKAVLVYVNTAYREEFLSLLTGESH